MLDRLNKYKVEGVDLKSLIAKTKADEIALLKIDIEGVEYDVLNKVDVDTLRKCRQIFVEFHHISVKRFTVRDSKAVVKRICEAGFESHSLDGLNYLFIRQ